MNALNLVQEAIYRLYQSAWSAWALPPVQGGLRARRRASVSSSAIRAAATAWSARCSTRTACRHLARAERAASSFSTAAGGTSSTPASWRALLVQPAGQHAAIIAYQVPNQWQGRFDALRGDRRQARRRWSRAPSPSIPTSCRACALWSACRFGSFTSCATPSTTSAPSRSGTSCRWRRASTSTSSTARRRRDSADICRPR